MWPILLDMTREESMQNLRCLELDAFSGLVTAFRAQGCLNSEKLRLLKATAAMLNIPLDRHKAEIRRAVNDEKLNTIAYHTTAHKSSIEDWTQEGRRLIPLLSRVAPQTVYSAIADEVADTASRANKLLPHPACTERKRSAPISPTFISSVDSNKLFRATQDGVTPKVDDTKKRKMSLIVNDTLSPGSNQLMGPPKTGRAQPLNRLRAKIKQKDNLQVLKIRQQHVGPEIDQSSQLTSPYPQQYSNQSVKPQVSQAAGCNFSTKIVPSLPITTVHSNHSTLDNHANLASSVDSTILHTDARLTTSASVPMSILSIDSNKLNLSKPLLPNKMIKMCPPRKTVTTSTGQKLVVVSNPHSIPSTSILQRTLTIPFVKNISVKNYDKFKIVPPSSSTQSPLFTSNTTTALNHFKNNTKHKVVTMRTNGSGHINNKVLPFSQIQMLNTKGAIKVLPFGSKLLSKSNSSSSYTNPIYVVNSISNAKTTVTTTDAVISPQMVALKHQLPVVSANSISNTPSPSFSLGKLNASSKTMLNQSSDHDSENTQQIITSADEFSSDSSDTVSDYPMTSTEGFLEENHVESIGNHVVEDEEDDEDEDGNECSGEDDEATEDRDTNESFKDEDNTVSTEEQSSFYMLENEDQVGAEMPVEPPPCVIEQLDTCPYSELENNEIHLQEELETLECEPALDSGITTHNVMDFNTFES